jgi:hypothetical protein
LNRFGSDFKTLTSHQKKKAPEREPFFLSIKNSIQVKLVGDQIRHDVDENREMELDVMVCVWPDGH